jgi:hypothetical protein
VNRSPFFMMIMSWRLTFPKHAAAQIRWRQQGKNSPATTRCLNNIDFLLIGGSIYLFCGVSLGKTNWGSVPVRGLLSVAPLRF